MTTNRFHISTDDGHWTFVRKFGPLVYSFLAIAFGVGWMVGARAPGLVVQAPGVTVAAVGMTVVGVITGIDVPRPQEQQRDT